MNTRFLLSLQNVANPSLWNREADCNWNWDYCFPTSPGRRYTSGSWTSIALGTLGALIFLLRSKDSFPLGLKKYSWREMTVTTREHMHWRIEPSVICIRYSVQLNKHPMPHTSLQLDDIIYLIDDEYFSTLANICLWDFNDSVTSHMLRILLLLQSQWFSCILALGLLSQFLWRKQDAYSWEGIYEALHG